MTAMQQLLRLLPPVVRGRLRAWRVQRLIANYRCRTVEHVYGSGTLRVYLSDPLAQGWYDHDWAELPEIAALRRSTLRPGARVFNIGAHQGVVAMMLAREVKTSGLVVAVEPNPHNAACARTNATLNVMDQIAVVEAAASDRTGTAIFNQGLDGQLDDGTGAGGRMNVVSVTLDDLAGQYGMPDLVTIDVEGAECMVLEGGRQVLAAGADFAVEVHVNAGLEKLGGSVARVLAFFPPTRFALAVRTEGDDTFRAVAKNDPTLRDRFFLLARAAKSTRS
jgi:FkbM family methyltransferase